VILITGAAAGAGAASLSPPPNRVVRNTPPAVTIVPSTPTIVFFKPDQVPSFCVSSLILFFIFVMNGLEKIPGLVFTFT
jgi:hypothetical protein